MYAPLAPVPGKRADDLNKELPVRCDTCCDEDHIKDRGSTLGGSVQERSRERHGPVRRAVGRVHQENAGEGKAFVSQGPEAV